MLFRCDTNYSTKFKCFSFNLLGWFSRDQHHANKEEHNVAAQAEPFKEAAERAGGIHPTNRDRTIACTKRKYSLRHSRYVLKVGGPSVPVMGDFRLPE